MLINNLQQKIIEKLQPLSALEGEIDWNMKVTNIYQSVFVSLSTKKVTIQPETLKPSEKFLTDLETCRLLPNLLFKYQFFNMMVRKYGFLCWQLPSIELGNFLEIECKIEFEEEVRLEEAIKQLKAMWKTHLWQFLQDYKKIKERKISFETLKELLNEVDADGKGFRFTRSVKGLKGKLVEPGSLKLGPVTEQLMSKGDETHFVSSDNPCWTINDDQLVFKFSPSKSNESIKQKKELSMSTIGSLIYLLQYIYLYINILGY